MRNKIFRIGRTLLFLSIGIFFLILAFRDVHFEDLIAGLLSAQYEWVLFSLVFAGLAFVSRAYRWKLLIEPIGYNPSAKHTFYALMSGHLANFIFPRLGEVTRCGSLNRTDKIPFDSLLGTVIVERISDLLALLLLILTVFFLKIDLFGNFLINNLARPLYDSIFAQLDFHWFIWISILLVLLLLVLSFRFIITWLGKYRFYRKLADITARVLGGMKSVMRMEKKIKFLAHTIFIWLMYYLMTAAIFKSLPSTAILDAADILFIMVIGGLGMAAPVQGGIGAYHWVVSVALGLYGIPREDGLVFATISHESQALFTILLGSVSFFMIFLISKRTNQQQEKLTNLNSQ
jgi:glycosyltransferase 2 family protein